jgi:transposase-like protein
MREELLKGLTEEQIKKVEACKNASEILALAKTEGVELNDEQLEAVNGGNCLGDVCPKCGSDNTRTVYQGRYGGDYECMDCGYAWSD